MFIVFYLIKENYLEMRYLFFKIMILLKFKLNLLK